MGKAAETLLLQVNQFLLVLLPDICGRRLHTPKKDREVITNSSHSSS
jgi:hypothetical protein